MTHSHRTPDVSGDPAARPRPAPRRTIVVGPLTVLVPAGFTVTVDAAHYDTVELDQLTLSFTKRHRTKETA